MSGAGGGGTAHPVEDGLLVVHGCPTNEELAAVVVAVTALTATGDPTGAAGPARVGRGWAAPARRMTRWPRRWGTGG
ncbi:acyl-CoA carboxylase epsilon subunit [Kitasatospora sp. NPDC059648]|uniref:acyl-CoA carboxylase epsilon subunit n=1 Tax=Kitasatospora sp. NPDC059648 TaxID=3346894 RepID=UPI0036A6E00D